MDGGMGVLFTSRFIAFGVYFDKGAETSRGKGGDGPVEINSISKMS